MSSAQPTSVPARGKLKPTAKSRSASAASSAAATAVPAPPAPSTATPNPVTAGSAILPSAPSTSQPTPYPRQPHEESPFVKPREIGLHQVAVKVLQQYAHLSQTRGVPNQELVWREYMYMLASTDDPILNVIIHGNMQHKKKRDAALRRSLNAVAIRNDKQPGIYMLELVEQSTAIAPSPNQLLTVLRIADDYANRNSQSTTTCDSATALLIDTWKGNKKATLQDMINGDRHYLPGKTQVDKYKVFRRNLKKLWNGFTPAEMDLPMSQPLREVGYSKDCKERLKKHYKHTNSNYIMGLLDAICHRFARQLGGTFTIFDKGEVIFLAWRDEQPMQAETLFTALAQADTGSGRGFCHADPGDTATSHYTDSKFKWFEIQQDVLINSCFVRNISKEVRRHKAQEVAKRAVEDKKTEIAWLKDMKKKHGQGSAGSSDSDSDDEDEEEPGYDECEAMVNELKPLFNSIDGMVLINNAMIDLGLDDDKEDEEEVADEEGEEDEDVIIYDESDEDDDEDEDEDALEEEEDE